MSVLQTGAWPADSANGNVRVGGRGDRYRYPDNFVITTVDVMEVLKGNVVPNPDRNASSMSGAVSTNGRGISR